ncbi:MAG: amino acid permease [Oligoflexia bacterium]|nr:amino acid permease [Oligoflexia bacterium]
MTHQHQQHQQQLSKSLRTKDLIGINVTAITSLRWLPIAASMGASAMFYWPLALTLFFIPLGWITAEMASAWPKQGGFYVWIKEAYGERVAFLAAWFYFVSNLFYYPMLITFCAVTLAFVFDPALKDNQLFVASVIIATFCLLTILNIKGVRTSKLFSQIFGFLGLFMPGVLILFLGAYSLFYLGRAPATTYTLQTVLPDLSSLKNILLLSTLMLAMSGIELTSIMGEEIESGPHTFTLSTLISGVIIVTLYMGGTLSLGVLIPKEEMGVASGIMDAMKMIFESTGLAFLTKSVALLIFLGSIATLNVWILGPIKLIFESSKHILPVFLIKPNQHGMPQNIIIMQAVFISFIVLITSLMPSVEAFYQLLIVMTTLTSFIPYLLLFSTFLKLRKEKPSVPRPCKVPGGRGGALLIGTMGILAVLLAIILPFIPAQEFQSSREILIYELQIILGPFIFGVMGNAIYARRASITKHTSLVPSQH